MIFRKKLIDACLIQQVKVNATFEQQIGKAGGLQLPYDSSADHASMASDKD
jgi:hypothetical protein